MQKAKISAKKCTSIKKFIKAEQTKIVDKIANNNVDIKHAATASVLRLQIAKLKPKSQPGLQTDQNPSLLADPADPLKTAHRPNPSLHRQRLPAQPDPHQCR
jgi:hypothetical protein